jgi:carboxypeptidase C (cathepsin A)
MNRDGFLRPVRTVAPLVLSLACLASVATAQAPAHNEKMTTSTTVTSEPAGHAGALPPDGLSEGSVTVGGKTIAYKAVAGMLTVGSTDSLDAQIMMDGRWMPESGYENMKPEDAPAVSRMFYTAYFDKDEAPGTRPIVFIYNGGPGSATMYLRMGSLGPVRIVTPDTHHQPGGPYKIIPNEYSLLDVADLVFIDAPGTGYSRVMGKNAFQDFYGIDQDAGAFDRFIRRFMTKFDKWDNPRFLFGESYGTTRDAVLCAVLQRHGVDLNGVVFLSQILSFDDSADGSDGNSGTENGFFLALPSFAATAWYHHKVPGQTAKKAAVAAKLESFTGVPTAVWMKANLRLTGGEFSKYLQDASDITTGRLDSRYEGPAIDPLAAQSEYDPFTDATTSVFEAGMNTYAKETLHFGADMTYKPSAREPGFNWDMKHRGPGGWPGTYTNVMHDLAYTMTVNPHMHVLLMGGYFDLGTLFFGATYEMKHLPMAPELQKNIDYKFFQTGHMVYINAEAIKGLHDRTAQFIRDNETGKY